MTYSASHGEVSTDCMHSLHTFFSYKFSSSRSIWKVKQRYPRVMEQSLEFYRCATQHFNKSKTRHNSRGETMWTRIYREQRLIYSGTEFQFCKGYVWATESIEILKFSGKFFFLTFENNWSDEQNGNHIVSACLERFCLVLSIVWTKVTLAVLYLSDLDSLKPLSTRTSKCNVELHYEAFSHFILQCLWLK